MTHRKMSWSSVVLVGCGVLLAAGGCDQSSKDRESLLREEASTLRLELDNQKNRNRDLASQNDQLKLRNQQLESDITTVSAAPVVSTLGGFQAEIRGGEIVVNLPSDVLFDSGRDTLKSSAKTSLSAVASAIKSDYSSKPIRLIGFTDSDPIKKSKDRYETNHHLGFERAYSVGEYLQSRGIPAKQISYASYGPNSPKGSKSASRRVELVVIVDK